MKYLFLLAATALSVFGTTIDNFNRPDAIGLGPNWTNLGMGSAQILNGQALSSGGTNVLVQYTGLAEDTIYADVSAGYGLGYVALVLAISDAPFGSPINYFIKVQQNANTGTFDSYAFYYGNNGSGGNSGPFANLITPFASGHIEASLNGRTATLTITPNGGGAVQTYTHTYTQGTLGSGVGLGFLGAASADNFGAGASNPVPEPASLALLFSGVGALALFRRLRS